jgi:hypothetical protein
MGVSDDDMGSMDSNTGIMRNKLKYMPLILAAVAAATISAAPIAMADPTADQSTCSDAAPDSICQSPGNVEINDSPGPVEYQPLYPYWEGDNFGGFHGGFHGGHR